PHPALPTLALGTITALLGLKLGAHVVTNLVTPYEFHRDEFLYLAMGTHFRPLHMDFPPLMALLGNAARVFGETSLFAVRIVPALGGTVILLLMLLIVRELGGRRGAMLLAAAALIFNPLFLRSANLFMPVALDQLWWTLGFYAVIRLRNTEDVRWWLVLGAAGGLGLLTKFSILFFGLAVLVGLLLTDQRKALAGPWPWIAILMAVVIGLPSIVGQANLGFPVVGQMEDLRTVQLQRTTFGEFLSGQVLLGPSFLLALIGTAGLLAQPALRRHRVAGWIAVTAFVVLAALRGKSYYVGPIYPVLYAAGAVTLQHVSRARVRHLAHGIIAGLVIAYGLFSLPFGLPILPPAWMARYAAATGITAAVTTNKGEVLPLPQDYGDMLAWRELVEAVARVHHDLPERDRERTVVYGANYGEAGALDFYGPPLGLPTVVSMAGSFYFFGPGDKPGEVMLFVGMEREWVDDACPHAEVATRVTAEWTVEENDVPVLVCRAPTMTVQEMWARNPEMGIRSETQGPDL
ncbi:MAG: glycosyltransferase family 39 protein, partial [Gemmatimonadales bacterium]|nr:glycosyltransferase family 39 protein [Gemmatimonadales bacterium]